MGPLFQDRCDAGKFLAKKLAAHANDPSPLGLGLPRGGVPVAFEVARAFNAPLDVFLVRKLGVPGYEELAMGAIASGGTRVVSDQLVANLRISDEQIEEVAEREGRELERRELAFRRGQPPVLVTDRICILVDDGLATGSTMRAAVMALKKQNPKHIIVAVP